MHMLLRTFWIFLFKKKLASASFNQETEYSMRVLPTDLDLLMHVNNGVYFSFMDFGRWNMIFRTGIYDLSKKKGWYSVVAGETIKFKRSLKLWDQFTIKTRVIGHDEKYFFIRQQFYKQSELMATGLVKVRFLKLKGGTVPTAEVLVEFKENLNNDLYELGQDWLHLEEKYLT